MANPLTGDFEAVLQISGSTVNRLLASMHQNATTKPKLAKFPTLVLLRIGDDQVIDGVKGTALLQIAAPSVQLIDGSSDRFRLQVAIRARFIADPGTDPLPEFIHGTVTADYQIVDIDPTCFGWGGRASEYLWVRVIRDTVKFTGTARDDRSAYELAAAGPN